MKDNQPLKTVSNIKTCYRIRGSKALRLTDRSANKNIIIKSTEATF